MVYPARYTAHYVAQYLGAGSGGGSGAPSSLHRYTQVTGWVPELLWLGNVVDVVDGETLVLQNAATDDNATDELRASLLNLAMFQFGNSTADAAEAQTPDILDIPDAPVSSAILIVFRVPVPGPFDALSLYGKRDPVAPNDGLELLINTGGDATLRLDADAVVDAARAGPFDNDLWHCFVAIINRSTGQLILGCETAPDSVAALPTGSASNAVLAALGAQRRPAIGHDDAVFGFQTGEQCEGRSANQIAEAMAIELFWEILVDDDGLPLFDDDGRQLYSWTI